MGRGLVGDGDGSADGAGVVGRGVDGMTVGTEVGLGDFAALGFSVCGGGSAVRVA